MRSESPRDRDEPSNLTLPALVLTCALGACGWLGIWQLARVLAPFLPVP